MRCYRKIYAQLSSALPEAAAAAPPRCHGHVDLGRSRLALIIQQPAAQHGRPLFDRHQVKAIAFSKLNGRRLSGSIPDAAQESSCHRPVVLDARKAGIRLPDRIYSHHKGVFFVYVCVCLYVLLIYWLLWSETNQHKIESDKT